MRILVHSADGHRISIPFPTALLTSPTVVNFVLKLGKKHAGASMPDIPPEALQALSQSIREIKKKYGTWELVHVESAEGDLVSIIL